jgi:hypothetical protein
MTISKAAMKEILSPMTQLESPGVFERTGSEILATNDLRSASTTEKPIASVFEKLPAPATAHCEVRTS